MVNLYSDSSNRGELSFSSPMEMKKKQRADKRGFPWSSARTVTPLIRLNNINTKHDKYTGPNP